MNSYEEKVNEKLVDLKRKDENNMNKNAIISAIYTITMVISILVCCICDIATSGTLTWSLIVLSSILVTFGVYERSYGDMKYWNDPDYLFDWTEGEFV